MGAFDHLEWTYNGAFEQLFGFGRGEFEQKFCKKYKCPGFARGGMFKLRFDWYINALSERIIGIYLHKFTNNERVISIPHEVASCVIENFEFIHE